MDKDRDRERFRTSTDIYGGFDTDYHTSYDLHLDDIPLEGNEVQEEVNAEAEKAPEAEGPVKKKKKRRKKHYFLRFVVVVAILAGTYLLLTSSIFAISTIVVEGNALLSDDEIIELSGVQVGDNMFKATNHKVSKNLTANPYVSKVTIDRGLPDIYTIKVTERTPVIAVKKGGKYIILDEDGYAVDESDTNMYATVVTGVSITDYDIGRIPSFDDTARFNEVKNLIIGINNAGMYFKKVEISSSLTVKCYVTDTLICSGRADNILDNIESIEVVLYDLDQKGVKRGIIKVGEEGYASFSPVTD